MTPRVKLAIVVAVLVLVSVLGGLLASWQTMRPSIRQTVDGVAMVKTRDAGWQVEKPGDYAETLLGGLVAEYGWALDTVPFSLPNTSGQCETFVSCITGGF